MKKSLLFLSLLIVTLLLLGCANAQRIKTLSVGMSKADVIKKLGNPDSVSARAGIEYMNYNLYATDDDAYKNRTTPYYVRIVNGSLESYGKETAKTRRKIKKLHSSANERLRSKANKKPARPQGVDIYEELLQFHQLREQGIITDGEFIKLKTKAIEKY